MTGGSGEQAVLMAAAAQVACHLNIPASIAAGMTDAKLPDAQSGFEKGVTTTLAGHAGAAMIHESAGMHASLLGCSLESFVIDNDMLGNVLRTIEGIKLSQSALSFDTVTDVNIGGAGHYLGEAQTLDLMQSEYRYPSLSDRQSIEEWEQDGSQSMAERARAHTKRILSEHHPVHISAETDDKIRAAFDIRLSRKAIGQA
jgi:trimethylamine--corrinoid protein Co-methyltransferase